MGLLSFFSRDKVKLAGPDIKFYKEANLFGEHGTIVVTNVKLELREQAVRFVFVGMTFPPKLDLNMMTYIWDQAAAQGYIAHELREYGRENDIVNMANKVIRHASERDTALSR